MSSVMMASILEKYYYSSVRRIEEGVRRIEEGFEGRKERKEDGGRSEKVFHNPSRKCGVG